MKKIFSHSFNPAALDLILLFARIAIGCLMLTHGLPKMYKMLDGNFQFADPMGMGEKFTLIVAVITEVGFSILLIFGLASRIALLGLIFTMIVAVFIVHSADPIGVKETAILYLCFYIVLFVSGSGKYSIDYLISKKLK